MSKIRRHATNFLSYLIALLLILYDDIFLKLVVCVISLLYNLLECLNIFQFIQTRKWMENIKTANQKNNGTNNRGRLKKGKGINATAALKGEESDHEDMVIINVMLFC